MAKKHTHTHHTQARTHAHARTHTHTFTISSDSSYYYYSDIIFRHDVLVEKVVIKHLLDFFIYIFIVLYIYKSFIPFVLFFF